MKKLFLFSVLFVLLFAFKGSAQVSSTFPNNACYAYFEYPNPESGLKSYTVVPDEADAGETTVSTYCLVWITSDDGPDFWPGSGPDYETGNTWSGVSYNQSDVDAYVNMYTNCVFHFQGEVEYTTDLVDYNDEWPLN